MRQYKLHDYVVILTNKGTERTGQTGMISTICRPTELYECRVKFSDEHPDHIGELFRFSDLVPSKNHIVQEIINDL